MEIVPTQKEKGIETQSPDDHSGKELEGNVLFEPAAPMFHQLIFGNVLLKTVVLLIGEMSYPLETVLLLIGEFSLSLETVLFLIG